MKNFFFTITFIACAAFCAKAQVSGSAGIVTNQNVIIPAGQLCDTLTATVIGGGQTSAYTVSEIAYNPPVAFDTGVSTLANTSDFWSAPVTLPFKFCFFGTAYHKIQIGCDGEISFDTINDPESWNIPGPVPFGNTEPDQQNCIMAPWESLDGSNQGIIRFDSGGTAPNRYFTVSWDNVPLYGDSASSNNGYCSRDHHQTSMVVLYETSNIIDIYIEQKDTICSDLSGGVYWNNGWATEGITDIADTLAYTVPGRNATRWAAYNDAWRFTPAGPPDYTLTWFEGTTPVGTGDSLAICPSGNTSYLAQVSYRLCDNAIVTIRDSVVVTLLANGIEAIATGKITLMPNPAHNQFEIVNANVRDNLKSLALYDELGNRFAVPYSVLGAGRISADINLLPAGLYYVFINYESGNGVLKMVKF